VAQVVESFMVVAVEQVAIELQLVILLRVELVTP
jgi:hypothetical protein